MKPTGILPLSGGGHPFLASPAEFFLVADVLYVTAKKPKKEGSGD